MREESADDFVARVRVYMREHDVAAPAAVDALIPSAPLSREAIEDLTKAGIVIEAQCTRMSARVLSRSVGRPGPGPSKLRQRSI
jgi:hypothetical protein